MINAFYDLHIHSCLSPCGSDDMTPANIAGLAALKGLDIIALTDHNSCRNCGPAMACGDAYGVLVVPGMELTTMEEAHVVCLFKTLEAALDFDSEIYGRLMKIPTKEAIFGRQLLMDEDDNIIGNEPNLLINATDISFDEVWPLVRSYDGAMIPAHIDKSTTSLLSNLGFIPDGSKFRTAEVHDLKKLHALRRDHPYLENCRIISDSDAHYMEHINEPSLTLMLEEKSRECLIETLIS